MSLEMIVKRIVRLKIVFAAMMVITATGSLGQTSVVANSRRETAIRLEQQGQNAEAEAAWHAVLKAHPANSEAYAHLGLLEARQEHYAEAVPLYRKALSLNPAMPGLRMNLGLSLFKSGAMEEAISIFTPLLKRQPASSPEKLRLTTLIGLAHYGLGEYAAAIPYLKEATAHDPQNLPFRLTLAHSCLWSKQYQCVLDVYHEILQLNAESAEADMLASEALDAMHDQVGAAQQFRAAVKADPRVPDVHFGLGYLLWVLLQNDEAAKEFEAELANNPDHVLAMVYLADTNMRLNHTENVASLLEKAIKANPEIELAHLDLGILYADGGRKDEALRELQLAARLTPGDINVHWRLARLYQSMGRKEEAKAEFDKTSGLQKAAAETVFNKLHNAQAKGKPADKPAMPVDK
jgi:tetratricopeptide (TPR) repeat protein